MFSILSLDSSITHARDTSDKRQLTYKVYFSSLFPPKCVKMNFNGVLPSAKFHSLWQNASSLSSYNFRKFHES